MSNTAVDKDNRPRDEDYDDDEPDEWDQRIINTGCAEENMALTDCYAEKKDWRQCVKEMQTFKECWSRMNNDSRTSTKQA